MTAGRVVLDAQALWQRLVEGEYLRPKTYDADLLDQLPLAMGLPSGQAIEVALAGVPAQDLVRCLLEIAEPFAEMLADLLRLYAEVGARTADRENLRLKFDFGNGHPLDLLLSAFREQVEHIQRVVVARQARIWTAETLWDLRAMVDRQPGSPPVDHEQFRVWKTEYDDRRWPTSVPRPDDTGIAAADEVVRRCVGVVELFLHDARRLADDRNIPAARWVAASEDALPPAPGVVLSLRDVAWADSDHWPAAMLEGLFRFADVVREHAATDRDAAERFAAEVAGVVGDHISAQPQTSLNVEEDVNRLVDLLSLPVWGKRHEMYSAWVLTEIVAAIGVNRITVHVVGGVLEFNFAGSHLATISTAEGPVELWAELRSAYAKPVGHGRSNAIQPDYRISRPPVTAPASALLAVECKQYWQSVRKNVADALADYAGGLPKAHVVVASHGKVSDAVMDKLTPDQRDRSIAVSGLRPNAGAPNTIFRRTIAAKLPARPPEPAEGGGIAPSTPLTITLTWPKVGVDLDLHAWMHWPDGSSQEVNYNTRGEPSASPAWLDRDDRDGRAPECITVSSPVTAADVWVHAFGGVEGVALSGATVSLRGPRIDVTVPCPSAGPGEATHEWWHVATVRGGAAVEIVGQLDGAGPS
ncbi:hypothetical protein EV643_103280 [Kribbella sp. VKM Ac-2527]|uniref:Uncharacterized protein n=1 Tax=Kribbella caucasensis TaxID=2512215 RepID=A0A4R6KKM9_9ACTN|nr:hypothetical protein [Kribbella sp. VKM Ac-2527]TDO51541.1 hypothetical protein EV643_103280 [Kribbella sp. VKM Ac-2527]